MRCRNRQISLHPDFSSAARERRKSVRHRENQNSIVGLVGDDRQIRKLVNSYAKLRRTAETEATSGLERIGNRVNYRNGLTGRIDGDDAAGLRVDGQRSRVDAHVHRRSTTRVWIKC